jgi:hypothetical protein
MIRREGVAVAHFQNTFPIISPAADYAAKGEGAPVVQSLRNYRLLCLTAQLYREGHVCTDCLARATPWPGVLHACYRDSRADGVRRSHRRLWLEAYLSAGAEAGGRAPSEPGRVLPWKLSEEQRRAWTLKPKPTESS